MNLNTKIDPILDSLVLEPHDKGKTAGGLYIPDSAEDELPQATVIAVGPGNISALTGEPIPMPVDVGDLVVYVPPPKNQHGQVTGAYPTFRINGQARPHIVVRVSEIICKLRPDISAAH